VTPNQHYHHPGSRYRDKRANGAAGRRQPSTSDEELDDFETDGLAGFVLARASTNKPFRRKMIQAFQVRDDKIVLWRYYVS
jgi:hypothetical protein